MRCTACQTENPNGTATCTACSAPLRTSVRKSRRRAEAPAAPDNPRVQEYNRQVRRVYVLSAWSLVPVVGAVLGPLSAGLAWRLLRRGRGDPDFTAAPGARWVRNLGLATTVTNWVGLTLIALSFYLS
ncbi:MAG: hypothetical protein U0736_23990 [Gemmataceae bacterium]